jgi:hypothetical protein
MFSSRYAVAVQSAVFDIASIRVNVDVAVDRNEAFCCSCCTTQTVVAYSCE